MSSIAKAVISIYRRGEEKTIERYKARISINEDSTKQGMEKDGVTIRGTSLKLFDFPAGLAAIESLAVCGRLSYFVSAKGPRTVGGLYSFYLAGGPVDVLLNNETNSCSEIKRATSFKNILAFADSGAYQVKVYDPVDKIVTVLVGSGQKGNEDETAKSCTFGHPHGICTVGETCDGRGNRKREANN